MPSCLDGRRQIKILILRQLMQFVHDELPSLFLDPYDLFLVSYSCPIRYVVSVCHSVA